MPARVKDIVRIMEEHYPLNLAEDWDNSGLQCGDLDQTVKSVALSLDPSPAAVNEACKTGIDLLITHHPLIFSPLKAIDYGTPLGKIIKKLGQAGISLYSAHTNLDSAECGLNQHLAELLELQDISALASGRQDPLYKLVIYVPESHADLIREALGQAGAGHIGAYRDCAFSVAGVGTFRPLPGTRPFIGSENVLERVSEQRLETVIFRSNVGPILQKVLAVHPYEEPAYDLYPLANQGRIYSPGRQGTLARETSLQELAQRIKERLGLDSLRLLGPLEKSIKKVMVVSGSGASFIQAAARQGSDLLITGDIKYHDACLARDLGLCLIDAGHHGTERIMVDLVAVLLEREIRAKGFDCRIVKLHEVNCLKNF